MSTAIPSAHSKHCPITANLPPPNGRLGKLFGTITSSLSMRSHPLLPAWSYVYISNIHNRALSLSTTAMTQYCLAASGLGHHRRLATRPTRHWRCLAKVSPCDTLQSQMRTACISAGCAATHPTKTMLCSCMYSMPPTPSSPNLMAHPTTANTPPAYALMATSSATPATSHYPPMQLVSKWAGTMRRPAHVCPPCAPMAHVGSTTV